MLYVEFSERYSFSRGSALYTNENGYPPDGLDDIFAFTLPENETHRNEISAIRFNGRDHVCHTRPVRPIPQEDDCFENVWREFRERKSL